MNTNMLSANNVSYSPSSNLSGDKLLGGGSSGDGEGGSW